MAMISFSDPTSKISVQEALEVMGPDKRAETWEHLKLASGWIKDMEWECVKAAKSMEFKGLERKPSKVDKKWIQKDNRLMVGTLKTLARKYMVRPGLMNDNKPISPSKALEVFPAKAEDDIKALFDKVDAKDTLKKVKG